MIVPGVWLNKIFKHITTIIIDGQLYLYELDLVGLVNFRCKWLNREKLVGGSDEYMECHTLMNE